MEFLQTSLGQIIILMLIVINIISFFVMLHDKRKAVMRNSENRTPEGVLFFWAIICGSLGIYIAMFTLRHKTQKWYFLIGIPIIFIQNTIVVHTIISTFS